MRLAPCCAATPPKLITPKRFRFCEICGECLYHTVLSRNSNLLMIGPPFKCRQISICVSYPCSQWDWDGGVHHLPRYRHNRHQGM